MTQLDIFGNVTEPMVIISASVVNVQSLNSAFTYTLTDSPVANSSIGNLIDSSNNNVGTINYLTGAYTFTSVTGIIPLDATIYAAVVPYQPSRPTDILFYIINNWYYVPVLYKFIKLNFKSANSPHN